MALIVCGDCAKEISDRATACPGCGAPVPGNQAKPQSAGTVSGAIRVERAGLKYETIGFVLILIAIVGGIAGLGGIAGAIGFIGFLVFMAGRFID